MWNKNTEMQATSSALDTNFKLNLIWDMAIHFFRFEKLHNWVAENIFSILSNSSNRLFHLKKILIPRREFNKVYVEINGIIRKRKRNKKLLFCYQQLLRWNKEEDKTSEMSLIAKSVK